MSIKISVLIPVYKAECFIKKCLLSVLNQSFKEVFEIILVNDCTPDNSMNIVQEIRSNHPRGHIIKVINHERNRGSAAARDSAIKNAKGDYVLFIDSDDYIEINMLQDMYEEAFRNNSDIVICDHYIEDENNSTYIKAPYNKERQEINYTDIIRGKSTYLWDKLIKRDVFQKNDIRWYEGINWKEDYMAIVSLVFATDKISYIPKAYYHYILYNINSISRPKTIKAEDIRAWLFSGDYLFNLYNDKKITKYEKDVSFYLLKVKSFCILNDIENRNLYLNCYPSATKYLLAYIKEQNCDLKTKIYLYVCLSNSRFLFNFIYFVKKTHLYKLFKKI